MLASMMTSLSVFSVLVGLGLIISILLTVTAYRGKKPGAILGVFPVLLFIALFLLVNPIGSPNILVKEISPGIFLNQYGELVREDVPKGIPVIYEIGDPKLSGYAIRWWRWVKLVLLDDPYDWRVAEEVIPIVCPVEDIISLHEDIQVVTIPVVAATWWRKKHPQGKVQAEVVFLVTPKDNGSKARIEKYVFQ